MFFQDLGEITEKAKRELLLLIQVFKCNSKIAFHKHESIPSWTHHTHQDSNQHQKL